MASADKDEYGTIFVNTQTAVPIRNTLFEMVWKQGPKAIQVDNSTAVGIATKEFLQKKSKAMDIRFYWKKQQDQTGTILRLLETGPINLRRLLIQTSSTWTSHSGSFQIFTYT